jgi:oxygen-independent coproporphyrinogen-3 oxidase
MRPVEEEKIVAHFEVLIQEMELHNFEHYEVSSFCRKSLHSRHNNNYWFGKRYIGLGPSAHSYNGESRQWNVENTREYIAEVHKGNLPFEYEILSKEQKFNEYILTSLRTKWGINKIHVQEHFGNKYLAHLENGIQTFLNTEKIIERNNHYYLTTSGKLIADGITAELFI